jgi:hypothetical protein
MIRNDLVLWDRRRGETCLSDVIFDKSLAGELSGGERAQMEQHLGGCQACSKRLAEIHGLAARFPEEVWIEGQLARAMRGASVRRWRWLGASALAAGLIAAASIAFWMRPLPQTERLKGGKLTLELVVRYADGHTEHVTPGENLVPGEAIRFRVAAAERGYLVVIGIDAAQAVTAYAPLRGAGQPISAGHDQLLDGSIILDDTLGPERIVSVSCKEKISVDAVVSAGRRALERAGGDPRKVEDLGIRCQQSAVLIQKVRAR